MVQFNMEQYRTVNAVELLSRIIYDCAEEKTFIFYSQGVSKNCSTP